MAMQRRLGIASLQVALTALLATTVPGSEPNAVTSASPGASSPHGTSSGTALRDNIRAFLRQAARQTGKPEDATVRHAVALYRDIEADTQLRPAQREPLRVALRNKLARWGEQIAQEQRNGPTTAPATVVRPKTLAQVPGAPGQPGQPLAAPAQPPVDHGRELLELIQDTIAPTTWDIHGGSGVIRYWAPGHALVVRQTGDVHEQLNRLLMEMR